MTDTTDDLLAELRARYAARTPSSAGAAARAERVVPGGISSHSAGHLPYPLTFTEGHGAHLCDLDGRSYLDLWGNYTSLVHGHGFPPVTEAVLEQMRRGNAWSGGSEQALQFAELLVERLPAAELVRFVASGTEAGIVARELALRFTGRAHIVMAEDAYHGFGIGSVNVRTAVWGDRQSFLDVLDTDCAAVFVEGLNRHRGVRLADRAFIEAVGTAAHEAGALFVLDEVVSLRLHEGGVQQVLGVQPDLTMLGKMIGGGLSLGAVCGRGDVMALLDHRCDGYRLTGTAHTGTLAPAAGTAALRHFTERVVADMTARSETIADRLAREAYELGVDAEVTSVGSLGFIAYVDADGLKSPITNAA